MKLKEPTHICKICFKEIKIHSLYTFSVQKSCICDECRRLLEPKFVKFSIGSYKGVSIYEYNQKIKQLIYQFKGCYDIELAEIFLEPFLNYYKVHFYGYLIIPVPSFKQDNEIRGFNHVIEIFKKLNLPIIEAIEKTEKYKQSDHTFKERLQVSKYIKLSCLENIRNKKILLVDDIYTTGSTLRSIVALLEPLGLKDLKILVVAKTVLR